MNKSSRAVEIQRSYYTRTAACYDQMHAHEASTDASLAVVLRDLKAALPGLFVCGVEPVAALLDQAVRDSNILGFSAVRATGEVLPFQDASFDAVCEFGILHHAANPKAVVAEMLRVARKAVFLSDSNRFGQGSRAARLIKLILWKCNLWRTYTFLRAAGKGYRITEGDGLSYSYSVYDSWDVVSRWADRIIRIPATAGEHAGSWFHPLLNSGSVMVCALRERG